MQLQREVVNIYVYIQYILQVSPSAGLREAEVVTYKAKYVEDAEEIWKRFLA